MRLPILKPEHSMKTTRADTHTLAKNYIDGLMKSTVDILIILDKNFQIKTVNERTCQLLNQKEENLIGSSIDALFLKRHTKFVERLTTDIFTEKYIYDRQARFKVRGKKSIPVSISLSLVKDKGKSVSFLLIAKDIKQFLMATDALKQKNEELETLVYRVSHDLKGPLASVTGLFQLLEYEEETLENLKHYLNLIQDSTTKLESTLSGLLEMGLATTDSCTNHEFNVRNCIEDIIAGFTGYPGRDDVILLLSANDELAINTEEKIFRSVLQNLIENSIKYRKPYISDSVTKISARKYKNGIKIKVKDNGQGMAEQVQHRAFDMFYRGNQLSEGSGLGLFIVKSNIEKLGGEIRIKSRIEHGTEMWVYLPNFDESRRRALLIKKS